MKVESFEYKWGRLPFQNKKCGVGSFIKDKSQDDQSLLLNCKLYSLFQIVQTFINWWPLGNLMPSREKSSCTILNNCFDIYKLVAPTNNWDRLWCNYRTMAQLHPAVKCTQIGEVYWHLMAECNYNTVLQLQHKFPPIIVPIIINWWPLDNLTAACKCQPVKSHHSQSSN